VNKKTSSFLFGSVLLLCGSGSAFGQAEHYPTIMDLCNVVAKTAGSNIAQPADNQLLEKAPANTTRSTTQICAGNLGGSACCTCYFKGICPFSKCE
jgi:hypothetical protein